MRHPFIVPRGHDIAIMREVPVGVRAGEHCQTVPVRLTQFWARMEQVLGSGYYASWAHDHVLSELGGRTVEQALRDGEDAKAVWKAVVANLGLPPTYR